MMIEAVDLAPFYRSLQPHIAKIAQMGGAVTARDVAKNIRAFSNGGGCLLDALVKAGYGHWENRPPSRKGGKPVRLFVLDRRELAAM